MLDRQTEFMHRLIARCEALESENMKLRRIVFGMRRDPVFLPEKKDEKESNSITTSQQTWALP